MKRLLIILFSLFCFNQNILANSLSIFGGSYDYDDDNTSSLIGLNYHLTKNDFNILNIMDINPVVGLFVTAESASMLYSGFETNLGGETIFLNLSSSAGLYNNGDGKDLGNTLQFKSEINLFYSLSKTTRIGLGSHHISNAGISSVNPGVNNYYLIFNRDF
ncbi:MAG: acyloxyacyl hydrolase [Alphaproteobacteria bacterium]